MMEGRSECKTLQSSLLTLPTELLHRIHLESGSEHLPLTCARLFTVYSTTTSDRYRAIYLWRKHLTPSACDLTEKHRSGRTRKWDKVTNYGCCTLEVLEILRSFDTIENPNNQSRIVIDQIPTRLFKPMSSSSSSSNQVSLENSFRYISTLLSDYRSSPDKTGGYPLARSVLSGQLRFVRLLLSFGARPCVKDQLVILLAISKGDLNLLRMLVEVDYVHPDEESYEEVNLQKKQNKKKHKNKRRKTEDRVVINDQMLEKALKRKDYQIARYLIQKGARPTLETIRLLESFE